MICSLRSDGDEKSKSERGNEGGDGGLHIHKDGYTQSSTRTHRQACIETSRQVQLLMVARVEPHVLQKRPRSFFPIERFNVCLRPAQLNGTSLTN